MPRHPWRSRIGWRAARHARWPENLHTRRGAGLLLRRAWPCIPAVLASMAVASGVQVRQQRARQNTLAAKAPFGRAPCPPAGQEGIRPPRWRAPAGHPAGVAVRALVPAGRRGRPMAPIFWMPGCAMRVLRAVVQEQRHRSPFSTPKACSRARKGIAGAGPARPR